MLKNIFLNLLTNYNADPDLTIQMWAEIEKSYSAPKRFYHNLAHLTALLQFLLNYKQEIEHWNALLFSIFYHDIVYNVLRSDNEERSAATAVKRLQTLNVDPATINICTAQILATKKHADSGNKDTNLFTDADLMVLGQPAPDYQQYCKQIRKEYGIYPELVYKPGRKKVLLHFLQMPRIYKTSTCFSLFESQARTNLETELKGL
jgi:predicted metal-dependent HD superfamily phosphohydrolase